MCAAPAIVRGPRRTRSVSRARGPRELRDLPICRGSVRRGTGTTHRPPAATCGQASTRTQFDELAHSGGACRRRIGEAKRLLAFGVTEFDRDRPLREAVAKVDLGIAQRILGIGGAELRQFAGGARLDVHCCAAPAPAVRTARRSAQRTGKRLHALSPGDGSLIEPEPAAARQRCQPPARSSQAGQVPQP